MSFLAGHLTLKLFVGLRITFLIKGFILSEKCKQFVISFIMFEHNNLSCKLRWRNKIKVTPRKYKTRIARVDSIE